MKKDFVVGFLISKDLKDIVLIEKNKPKWQSGLLNGVGGKIENYDKSPKDAMSREFMEEAYAIIDDWRQFLVMDIEGNDPDPEVKKAKIYCFYSIGDYQIQSKTNEPVNWRFINWISDEKCHDKVVPNLKWLIPMVLDQIKNPNSFKEAVIKY